MECIIANRLECSLSHNFLVDSSCVIYSQVLLLFANGRRGLRVWKLSLVKRVVIRNMRIGKKNEKVPYLMKCQSFALIGEGSSKQSKKIDKQ